MALTPEELIEQERLRQETLAHTIAERQTAIDALQADITRLNTEEAQLSGAAQKAQQDEAARIAAMDDQEFAKLSDGLLREARKKDHARSGVKLTQPGPHDD